MLAARGPSKGTSFDPQPHLTAELLRLISWNLDKELDEFKELTASKMGQTYIYTFYNLVMNCFSCNRIWNVNYSQLSKGASCFLHPTCHPHQ